MDNDGQYEKMSLIRKIVLITVFVLLVLCFIFFLRLSFKPNSKIDKNYNKNLDLMKEAAVNYFTKETFKENSIISLKKMYELNLIKELKTSYGDKCIDIASFAQIKENEEEYLLEVTLICGDKSETISEKIELK